MLNIFLSIQVVLLTFIITANRRNYCNLLDYHIYLPHFMLNPFDVINQSISISQQYPFSYVIKFLISYHQFIFLFFLILYPYLLLFLALLLTFISLLLKLFQPLTPIRSLYSPPIITIKTQQIPLKLFFIFIYILQFLFLLP